MKKRAKIVEAYIKSSTPQEMMYDVLEKMQQMKLDFTEMHAHIDRDVRDVEMIKKVIRPLIPKVRDGEDGEDGHTPTKVELLEIIKPLIPEVKDGEDGIDGSPDKPEEIRDKLASLKGKERLSVFSLKDTEWLKGNGKGQPAVQWNAVGGLSKVATDTTLTGDGTDSNPLHVVGGGGSGSVDSVTGLNTDNTDPTNPIVKISVDGVTITGDGTPASPLVAAGGSSAVGTWYNVSGTVNSSNVTFTIPVVVSSDFVLQLGGQVQSLSVSPKTYDYSYAPGVGTTVITMTVAPDASLAGSPFQAYVVS